MPKPKARMVELSGVLVSASRYQDRYILVVEGPIFEKRQDDSSPTELLHKHVKLKIRED